MKVYTITYNFLSRAREYFASGENKSKKAFFNIKTDGINVNGWVGRLKAYNASLHETIFI